MNKEFRDHFSSEALKVFDSLASGYQKSYISHITSAKTEKTLNNRISEVETALVAGFKSVVFYKKSLKEEVKTDDLTDGEKFELFYSKINDIENIKKIKNLIQKIENDNKLTKKYAWNKPMLTDHGTYIIGFDTTKNHMSISVELEPLEFFRDVIHAAGYETTTNIFKIKWTDEIDYTLIDNIVKYNIKRKVNTTTFFTK